MTDEEKTEKKKLQEENLTKLLEARRQIRVYLSELIVIPDDLIKEFNEKCQCNY